MDINQNQLTNTFVKGMNTDTSDMYLSSDQYRYAENIRIITNQDSNSGEVRLIEGNVNIPIYTKDAENKFTVPLKVDKILSFDTIRDMVVLITETITETGDTWSVYRVNITKSNDYISERNVYESGGTGMYRIDPNRYLNGTDLYNNSTDSTNYINRRTDVIYNNLFGSVTNLKGEAELVFGPCTEAIWTGDWDGEKEISTVLRWESEKNVKLYIADSTGKHSIIVLNVMNKYPNANFDKTFAYQRTLLPPPEVEISQGSGSIMSGKVQYVYRLYSKNSPSTPLSILSKPLSLYKNEYSGYEAEKKSGRAVNITVLPQDNDLDYIQVYRISYQISGQLPTISLVKDEKLYGTLIDTGQDIQELGISEFLAMFTPYIYPKQIESKGDYLFAANMNYSLDDVDKQIDWFDARSYSRGNYILDDEDPNTIYRILKQDGTFNISDPVEDKLKHKAFPEDGITPEYKQEDWDIISNLLYTKNGPSGDIIINDSLPSQSFNLLKVKDIIDLNDQLYVKIEADYEDIILFLLVITYTLADNTQQSTGPWETILLLNSSDIIHPLINFINNVLNFKQLVSILIHPNLSNYKSITISNGCNGVGKYICWKYIYDELPKLSPQNLTGSAKYSNATFRCGETYRFGVKLYDIHGNASSVKWIADIMIPDACNIVEYNNIVTFRNVGIKFFKTPGSDWQDIAGWEIVRCERTLKDRKAITLGIIGFPLHEYDAVYNDDNISYKDTNLICTPGILTTESIAVKSHDDADQSLSITRWGITDNSISIFSSPEYCYQPDDVLDILRSHKGELYITSIYNYISEYKKPDGNWYELDQIYNSNLSFYFYPQTPSNMISYGTNGRYYMFHYELTKDWHNNLESGHTGRGNKESGENYNTYNYINYFTPNYFNLNIDNNIKCNIQDLSVIDSPKSSDFALNEQLTFKNNTVTIGDLLFINWSAPNLLSISGESENWVKAIISNVEDDHSLDYEAMVDSYAIGSGGKCILFSHDNDNKIPIVDAPLAGVPSVTVVNVNKQCIPYGGYNKSAIENSSYISFGDYSNEDNIIVFSGDTYNRIFTYNASHIWYDSTYKNCSKMANIYTIPVETDIDIQALYGTIYGVEGFTNYNIQDTAGAFSNYALSKGSYLYNPAYNATPDIVSWTTPEILETKQDGFDTRIHYSNVKTNNEDIDSWTLFQAANFLDVDSRYGEITDLKLFKDKLIFWQENATGILAVNERVVLNDQNDTQVVLGTGGVLERYDYFTTVYGQKKNLHARAISNDALYWWDSNNKEILGYQQKYDVTPLSTAKNVKNYINKYDESLVPFIGYDNKYKEVLFNVVNEEALVYNEQIQAFTSIYKFSPMFGGTLEGDTLLTSVNDVYMHNIATDDLLSRLFDVDVFPMLSYVVNKEPVYTKTYDIQTLGGRFYGGGSDKDESIPYGDKHTRDKGPLTYLEFDYRTPLKQQANINGDRIENVEYDYRLTIPRNGETAEFDPAKQYGNRMKGKFMLCDISSTSNNLDFSLQYVTTKFRMSWD